MKNFEFKLVNKASTSVEKDVQKNTTKGVRCLDACDCIEKG